MSHNTSTHRKLSARTADEIPFHPRRKASDFRNTEPFRPFNTATLQLTISAARTAALSSVSDALGTASAWRALWPFIPIGHIERNRRATIGSGEVIEYGRGAGQ